MREDAFATPAHTSARQGGAGGIPSGEASGTVSHVNLVELEDADVHQVGLRSPVSVSGTLTDPDPGVRAMDEEILAVQIATLFARESGREEVAITVDPRPWCGGVGSGALSALYYGSRRHPWTAPCPPGQQVSHGQCQNQTNKQTNKRKNRSHK